MSTTIYVLSDPETDELRYVGKTEKSLKVRLRGHRKDRKRPSYRGNWIASLHKRGVEPKIEAIEVVEGDGSEEEMFYIAYFKALGFRLVNGTVGGDGRRKGSKMSDETRAKMSAAHMGVKRSPFTETHLKNIALAKTGVKASEETRRKQSVAHTKQRLITDQFGNIYTSIVDAARRTGANSGSIHSVLNPEKTAVSAKGYFFRLVETDQSSGVQ